MINETITQSTLILPKTKKGDLISIFINGIVCFDFKNYLVYSKCTKRKKEIGIYLDFKNNSVKYYTTEKSKYQNKNISFHFFKQLLNVLYIINKENTNKILNLYNFKISDLPELSGYIQELENSNFEPFLKESIRLKIKQIHKNQIKEKNKNKIKSIVKETYNSLKYKNKLKKEIHNRIKEKTMNINSKDKKTKREEIFEFSPGFNNIAESLGVFKQQKDDIIIHNFDDEPYFLNKLKNRNIKSDKEINSLVLWDIENINFYNDFSVISRFIKNNNQIKIVSFSKKFKNFYNKDIDFELNKLRKRNWIIKEVKNYDNSADNELIKEYFNYSDKINNLIIISSDKDFNKILIHAKNKNIKTTVIYREQNQKNKWFLSATKSIELKEIK